MCVRIHVHSHRVIIPTVQKCEKPVKSTPITNLSADVNLHLVATEDRKQKVIFVQLFGQHIRRCIASSGRLLQQMQSIQFLNFMSSATSGIFQNHCLRSLCKSIGSTYKIEVSGLALPQILSSSHPYFDNAYSQKFRQRLPAFAI